ncbi:MAG: hypothetical protein U1F77_09975 [Kiritimatiellia bacterium]
MKTMKMIASVLFSAAAITVVNAQTVPSVNAAGYIKVTCQPSKFQFVQNPFNSFDGSTYHLSQIIGTSLPELSKVFIWNENTQRFDIFQYDEAIFDSVRSADRPGLGFLHPGQHVRRRVLL